MQKRVIQQLLLLFMAFNGLLAQPFSSKGHFLETKNGQPFFWYGDTAWELFHKSSREEIEQYLENRRQKGFNIIQAVAVSEFMGLSDPFEYGDLPFIDTDVNRPAVTPGADPKVAAQYDYWDHVYWACELASKKGINMCVLPTWGEWVTPRFHQAYFKDTLTAYRFGHFIASRLKPLNNVVWCLGGDRLPNEKPWAMKVWRAMAEGIADATNGIDKPDGQANYTSTFMTYHCFASTSDFFPKDEWVDLWMWGSYHEEEDYLRSRIQAFEDWNKADFKPSLNSEAAYENHPWNYDSEAKRGYVDDITVRRDAYYSVFSGTCGHTYGCHNIWRMYAERHGPLSIGHRNYWNEVLDLPGAKQVGILKKLVESRPWQTGKPDNTLLNWEQTTSLVPLQAFVAPTFACVYTPEGEDISLKTNFTKASKLRAWWFDPKTARAYHAADFENTGQKHFFTPGNTGRGNDWVLVVEDLEQQYASPGKDK
jgi:hypothetical protein